MRVFLRAQSSSRRGLNFCSRATLPRLKKKKKKKRKKKKKKRKKKKKKQ